MNDYFSFTHLGATAVDVLIRDRDSTVTNLLLQTALARLVSTVVFPILASLDVIVYAVPTFAVSLAAPFSDKAASIAKKQFLFIGKSLLGIVASPLGLLAPDLVTYHFLRTHPTPEKQISDFGKVYSTPVAHQETPSTIEEVQDLVRKAKREGLKIGVAGAQLAQGGHTIPSQIQSIFIRTNHLNSVQIERDKKIATVGPGATWEDVQRVAHRAGLAVQVMQASNIFSVGGSLSTNVHGWDHRMGSLIHTVRSITIIDANGDRRKLNKDAADPEENTLFNSVMGGYGLFGIIVEAELALTDDAILKRQAEIISVDEYAKHFRDHIQGDDGIALHYGRLSLDSSHLLEEVTSVKYTKCRDADYRRPAELPLETRGGAATHRILIHTMRRLQFLKGLQRRIEHRMFLRPVTTSRNETMTPHVRFIEHPSKADADMLQEYFVPPDELAPFLKEMKAIVQKNQINLINATIRYVRKDEQSALAYARQDCFAIVLYFNQSLAEHQLKKMEAWTQEMVQKSLNHHGSFYLPYHRFPTVDQFRQAYPRVGEFTRNKHRYDPQETFSSQFYAHYFDRRGKEGAGKVQEYESKLASG